jgi:hypothetical protein
MCYDSLGSPNSRGIETSSTDSPMPISTRRETAYFRSMRFATGPEASQFATSELVSARIVGKSPPECGGANRGLYSRTVRATAGRGDRRAAGIADDHQHWDDLRPDADHGDHVAANELRRFKLVDDRRQHRLAAERRHPSRLRSHRRTIPLACGDGAVGRIGNPSYFIAAGRADGLTIRPTETS